jgi:hypothetical protein
MAQVTTTGNGYILYATANVGLVDEANNRSRIDYDLSLRADSSPSGFTSFSPDEGLTYIILNGAYYTPVPGQRTVNRGDTVSFLSGSVFISHTSAGVGSWTFSGRLEMFQTQSSLGYMPPVMTTASGTVTSTNFVRLPGAPTAAPTVSRTTNGLTTTITSSTASSPVSLSDYEFRSSTNGTTFGAAVSMGLDRVATFTGTSTQIYYFQTRGVSSEGAGPWSATATAPALPSTPASITLNRTARNVTVTVGPSATNGGSAISGYSVQFSTNGGSSWSTAEDTVAGSYTYTALTAGLTYQFRAFATNSVGDSAFVQTSIFVPAGGKRFDGSAWASTATAKRFDGSTWVDLTTAKRFDGTVWADLL